MNKIEKQLAAQSLLLLRIGVGRAACLQPVWIERGW